ncbi:MAG: fibrobacter succinogenes major paralogous domain-containing protein [Tenuifilum sp.]|uniref:fibrobacter succinogenes major paralogous domain-containing protein n=1 Tax=Tenuifilum sp. TaxID=2760880 RepID=UPI00309D83C0
MKCLRKAMVVLLVLLGYGINAQVPQRIAYQAVLRNADGTVMANQQVELQVLLHRTTATGDVVYSETHTKTTTNQGLVSFEIGAGTVNAGTFSGISWSDPIFLELKVKKQGQQSFTDLGTSQIVAVPYAFLAEKSLNASNGISSLGPLGNTVFSNGVEWAPTARVSVLDSTVIVSPGEGHDPDKPIFAVTNSQGQVVMAVYETGVRFNVEGSSGKGAKGGFAVGGLTNGKAPVPTYFQLEPSYAQFLFDQTNIIKGAKGGFAVGGLTNGKGDTLTYMTIHPDSTRFFIDDSPVVKGAKGGFAVGGLTNGKSGTNVYMSLLPDSIRFAFDDSNTKGAKGGFAVGGLTNAKSSAANYLEVTPDSTYIVNTMVSYSDMVVAGNVTTNVGLPEPPVADADGNTYQTVKIGTQVWMAENLKTTKYSDGTPIEPSNIYVLPTPDSTTVFGNYYSDGAILLSGKNVCPDGWHVPTKPEWEAMFTFVSGAEWAIDSLINGKKLIEPLRDVFPEIFNWYYDLHGPLSVVIATNETGFSARGAGRASWDTSWSATDVGEYAYFWVNTIPGSVQIVTIDSYSGNVSIGEGSPGTAYSVRCVKN